MADLVGEVDVTRRVDEIEPIDETVARGVLEADRPCLDGDPLLALEVHRIEDLAHHLAPFDRVGQLQEPVGERGLAVIDVGDDREVVEAGLRYRVAHVVGSGVPSSSRIWVTVKYAM